MNFLILVSALLAMVAAAPALDMQGSSKQLNPALDEDDKDDLSQQQRGDEDTGDEDEDEGDDDDIDMDDVGLLTHEAYFNTTHVDGQDEHDVTAAAAKPNDYVKWHNYYRNKHKFTKNLKKSKRLIKAATKWAKKCGGKQHSPNALLKSGRNPKKWDGENIALGMKTYKEAIDAWYAEIDNWSFSKSASKGKNAVTGHFTQVVWKSTKQVGCFRQKCGNKYLTVCQYSPAGNIGKDKANVMPLK